MTNQQSVIPNPQSGMMKETNGANGAAAASSLLTSDNAHFVEVLYAQYLADPNTVSEEWRDYFSQLTAGPAAL